MMRLQEAVYRFRGQNGRLPRYREYEFDQPGLTVSDASDTSVTFYSGVEGTNLLTLHLRMDGILLTSRR